MIVDSSAIVALLADEPEGPALRSALLRASEAKIGAATLVEASAVVAARMKGGALAVRDLLDAFEVQIVPLDEPCASAAIGAWARFGKGNHPARLNLGDCLTYGVAAVHGAPILCIGNDFAQTDAAIVPLG